jgi:hypothetical protein
MQDHLATADPPNACVGQYGVEIGGGEIAQQLGAAECRPPAAHVAHRRS